MNINIKQLRVKGFRGIADATVRFSKHSVLVGSNNTGKTALMEAMALLLGKEKVLSYTDDYDFFGGFATEQNPSVKRFSIEAVIAGFDPPDTTRHGSWFVTDRAGAAKWWDCENQELLLVEPSDLDTNDNRGKRYLLAVEIGCCGFYSEEDCEYKVVRYFVDGACDPAVDTYNQVPNQLLRELGVFLLPSQRTWEKALTLGASSFLKLLRENGALPHQVITELRKTLASIQPAPEKTKDLTGNEQLTDFGKLVASVRDQMQAFGLIEDKPGSDLIYRPTSLDVHALLGSLTPHVLHDNGTLIPTAKHGAGFLALQNLMLLANFAKNRMSTGGNCILLVEEPELHLHPGIQRRITRLVQSHSCQSIITTHSPHVASAFQPEEVSVIQRRDGALTQSTLASQQLNVRPPKYLREYWYTDRVNYLSAVMARVVLIPEGFSDASWIEGLRLIAEEEEFNQSMGGGSLDSGIGTFSIVRTRDGCVAQTAEELQRLGCQCIPLVDGDDPGKDYATLAITTGVSRVIRWPNGESIECIIAWVLEPGIGNAEFNTTLVAALQLPSSPTSKSEIIAPLSNIKKSIQADIVGTILAEAAGIPEIRARATKLILDISRLLQGEALDSEKLHLKWQQDNDPSRSSCIVFDYE